MLSSQEATAAAQGRQGGPGGGDREGTEDTMGLKDVSEASSHLWGPKVQC